MTTNDTTDTAPVTCGCTVDGDDNVTLLCATCSAKRPLWHTDDEGHHYVKVKFLLRGNTDDDTPMSENMWLLLQPAATPDVARAQREQGIGLLASAPRYADARLGDVIYYKFDALSGRYLADGYASDAAGRRVRMDPRLFLHATIINEGDYPGDRSRETPERRH
jgi:hypothetical protein